MTGRRTLDLRVVSPTSNRSTTEPPWPVQALHASSPLSVRRGSILPNSAHHIDRPHKQQLWWSEIDRVAVRRCPTNSHVTRRSNIWNNLPRAWDIFLPWTCFRRIRKTFFHVCILTAVFSMFLSFLMCGPLICGALISTWLIDLLIVCSPMTQWIIY